MKRYIFVYIFFLFLLSCENNRRQNIVKKTKTLSINKKYYDINLNNIYEVGNKYTYAYKFINSKHKETISSTHLNQIENIVLEVVYLEQELRGSKHLSKDLAFSYNYKPQMVTTYSTIIENKDTVWMHPPRYSFFKILEINPFPFILKPIKVGTKWNWTLKIGEQYGDKRWKEWEKEITNISSYEIIKDTMLLTKLGKLHCYITKSTARSKIGQTHLISFFNDKYGFVKLDYINIDGSMIILELKKHKRMPKNFF